MTLSEFKAWLEGYSAVFTDGHPNKQQWQTIMAKMSKVVVPRDDNRWHVPYFPGPAKGLEPPPIVGRGD